MEKIKVAFVDFWPEWNQENFLLPILMRHFEVVEDKQNPDVVFHSIFGGMQETPKYKCKKVLFLGENWRPGQFKSDYSISFDPHSETNYRLPLWQVFLLLNPEQKTRLYNRVYHTEFDHFCAFTVSNPSNTLRNSQFDKLHQYKRVQAYGKVRTNNMGLINLSRGKYWRDAKDEFFTKSRHKFMMAYENTSYPGYCTEKLMDAFLSGSVPIYWGDPKVSEDWNPEAFINMNNYRSEWEFGIEHIKSIDGNDEKFQQIYGQPVFTEEQKKKHEANMLEFEEWLINIVKNG